MALKENKKVNWPTSIYRLSKCFLNVDYLVQTFNEVQKLLSKTNGKVVGDLMTPAPVVVRQTTNLEDAARFDMIFLMFVVSKLFFFFFPLFTLPQCPTFPFPHCSACLVGSKSIELHCAFVNNRLLLETKYRRLPVVDADGKLVRHPLLLYWLVFPHGNK